MSDKPEKVVQELSDDLLDDVNGGFSGGQLIQGIQNTVEGLVGNAVDAISSATVNAVVNSLKNTSNVGTIATDTNVQDLKKYESVDSIMAAANEKAGHNI